jgi:hypothetical protein
VFSLLGGINQYRGDDKQVVAIAAMQAQQSLSATLQMNQQKSCLSPSGERSTSTRVERRRKPSKLENILAFRIWINLTHIKVSNKCIYKHSSSDALITTLLERRYFDALRSEEPQYYIN